MLYAIGIIFVVGGHSANGGINVFFDWFAPYAFHLGIFAFGAGYFYKNTYSCNQLLYLKKKIYRLIVPFFLCNLFYGILVTILHSLGMPMGEDMSYSTLVIRALQDGHQFIYNLGTWFVVPLFVIEIFNNILYKVTNSIKHSQVVCIFALYLMLGGLSVSLSRHGYNTGWYLLLTRSMFLLPMFGLGLIYRKYRIFDNVNNWIFLGAVVVFQYLLLLYYRGSVGNLISWMTGFRGGVLLPFCLEFLGIFFWLRISAILTPVAKGSKVISLIGAHTFEIMAHHLLAMLSVKAIFACFALVLPIGFDFVAFRENIWYYYCPRTLWQGHFIYLVAGVGLPILYVLMKKEIMNRIVPILGWKKL